MLIVMGDALSQLAFGLLETVVFVEGAVAVWFPLEICIFISLAHSDILCSAPLQVNSFRPSDAYMRL